MRTKLSHVRVAKAMEGAKSEAIRDWPAALVYAFFAAACFRLTLEHGYERAVAVGEGSFALLGAASRIVCCAHDEAEDVLQIRVMRRAH
jgi:hypothetical protein